MLTHIAILVISIAAVSYRLWLGVVGIPQLAAVVVQILACVGILGLVLKRPIAFRWIWRLLFGFYAFLLIVSMLIIAWLWLSVSHTPAPASDAFLSVIVGLAVNIPTFLGLYLYSYRCPKAWPNNSFKPNPLRGSA